MDSFGYGYSKGKDGGKMKSKNQPISKQSAKKNLKSKGSNQAKTLTKSTKTAADASKREITRKKRSKGDTIPKTAVRKDIEQTAQKPNKQKYVRTEEEHTASIPRLEHRLAREKPNGESDQTESIAQAPLQSTRSEASAEQHFSEKRAAFESLCEKSIYLKRNRRHAQSDAAVSIHLPKGLPSKLLLRALEQQTEPYEVLVPQYVQASQEHDQSINVMLDQIPLEKLAKLAKELDALISQFTARS